MTDNKQTGTCPMCSRQTEKAFRPFCSRRCAELDLARWLKGSYAIPGPPASPEDLSQVTHDRPGSDTDQDR